MVDTTNNTAENGNAEENPQSILEKRLAEINARKDDNQTQPTGDVNSVGNVIGNAVSNHEAVPPAAAVPPVGASGNELGMAPEFTPLLFTETPAASPNHQTHAPAGDTAPDYADPASASITADATPENNSTDAMDTLRLTAPENDTTPLALTNESDNSLSGPESVDLPPAKNIPAESYDTEMDTLPDMLSTAGVIIDTRGESKPEAETRNPEAASAISAETPELPAIAATTDMPAASSGEPAEDHSLEEDHHEELVAQKDYSTLSLEDIRKQLSQVLKTATRQQSREIFELYRQYEAKLAEEKGEALQKFTSEGGAADDFEYKAGPEHQEIEKAFQQFRESRSREQRQDEEQKVKNGKRKQELLDQLRELVESPETKSSGDKIKQIQSEWKGIGPVPTADSKQLWNSYHALLDIFYNNRSIFNELKELDRRRNLQHKIQLCERAESLIDQPSINVALQDLRNLHEEWKHVGPVPNEHRDSIWERFIQASEKVHGRKKDFISARKSVEQDNLIKKSELLFRMDPFQSFQTDRINDWRDKTDEIQKLKEEWDAIGLVPKERADEINKRFWSSYKAFFNHKNAFFKNLDEQKMQNLRLKTELCEQAESLKDSNDWDETKETLIQLQKKWKTIGRVPDKYSDKLWQRFRTACNEFFDRKQNQITQKENESNQASQAKTSLYEQLASRMTSINTEPGSYAEFEELRDNYLALPVTKFSGKTDDRYFDLLQKYVGSIVDLPTEDKDNLAAQLQVTRIKTGPDAANRIHQKEQAIKRDIGQLENDIRTLKTNIEFFGRSKNAEKLREEYNARIEEADHRIQQLQRQLQLIRNS